MYASMWIEKELKIKKTQTTEYSLNRPITDFVGFQVWKCDAVVLHVF